MSVAHKTACGRQAAVIWGSPVKNTRFCVSPHSKSAQKAALSHRADSGTHIGGAALCGGVRFCKARNSRKPPTRAASSSGAGAVCSAIHSASKYVCRSARTVPFCACSSKSVSNRCKASKSSVCISPLSKMYTAAVRVYTNSYSNSIPNPRGFTNYFRQFDKVFTKRQKFPESSCKFCRSVIE